MKNDASALTIDLPLPGCAQDGLVPGGSRGRHREVSDSAVAPGTRPHSVARTTSSQLVAHGAVSGPNRTGKVLKKLSYVVLQALNTTRLLV